MKKQKSKSILRFDDFYVESFNFVRNKEFEILEGKKVKLDFDFDFDFDFIDDERFIRVIKCSIFDEKYKENNKPFHLKIIVHGIFCVPNFNKENEMHNEIIQKNTLAILFPYVRSAISHMTMEMQIEPVRLPPLNIKSFFEVKEEKNTD